METIVRRLIGLVAALLAAAGLSIGLPSTAGAAPACALRVTVTTGGETLRPDSTFWVGFRIWTGEGYKFVHLDTNGNPDLPGGTKSWSSKPYFVAPQVTPDSRGYRCIESLDIRGVQIGIKSARFYDRWDQWDLARLKIADSVTGEEFFDSAQFGGLPKRLSLSPSSSFPKSVWWAYDLWRQRVHQGYIW